MYRLLVFLLLALALPARAEDAGVTAGDAKAPTVATLTVEIVGFKSEQGTAKIALYRTKDDYLKKAERSGRGTIQGGKATVVLEGLEPGTLVVSAFHDENDNDKLDSNWIGIPKEGTGVSNNAKGRMGPPKFDDARFELKPGGNTVQIKLVYL